MFTFNKNTGIYNVAFGNVPQKSKLQKMKQLIPDDQDPIFLVPLPTGSVVVFDNDTGRYTRKDKGKQRMETESESESELNDDEIDQLEMEIEMDMKRQSDTDLIADNILEDLVDEAVEEEEKKALVISRDDFIQKHNDAMAKGIVAAIRKGNTRIPNTILEKTPDGLYDQALMLKLSYDINAA
jgi:hypothetical protein